MSANLHVGHDRRGRMIAAALHLIAREGVAATTTRKIAHEAGLNLATLHYLFGGKDDLLLAVLDEVTSTIIASLAADVQPSGGLRAALTGSITALAALVGREPNLPLVRCEVILHVSRDPARLGAAQEHHHRYVEALRDLYRRASPPGETDLALCNELAELVSGRIDGLALQSVLHDPRRDLAQARECLLRAALALTQVASPADVRKHGATPEHGGPPGNDAGGERTLSLMGTDIYRDTRTDYRVTPNVWQGR